MVSGKDNPIPKHFIIDDSLLEKRCPEESQGGSVCAEDDKHYGVPQAFYGGY